LGVHRLGKAAIAPADGNRDARAGYAPVIEDLTYDGTKTSLG